MSKMKNNQYYYYGTQITLEKKFTKNEVEYGIFWDDDDGFIIHPMRDVKKWEDTWTYQEQQKKEAELEDFKKRKQEIVENIQQEALKSLKNRVLLNTMFAKDGQMSYATVTVVNELEKIIQKLTIK